MNFLLFLTVSITSALPVDENNDSTEKLQEIKHQLLNPSLNSVLDEEDDQKDFAMKKGAPVTEDIFPDRQGFFSGHRIPFELFSQETIHELKNVRK